MELSPEVVSDVKRLSPCVHLIEPSDSSQKQASRHSYSTSPEQRECNQPLLHRHGSLPSPPRTIVLSAWPGASPSQLSRYISSYQTLYPSAQILLITTSMASAFLRTSTLESYLTPAIDALSPSSGTPRIPIAPDSTEVSTTFSYVRSDFSSYRSSEKPSPTTLQTSVSGTILLHVFSTPSATTACALLRLYRAQYAAPLPLKAIILDTAPVPALQGPGALIQEAARLRRRSLQAGVEAVVAWVVDAVLGFVVALVGMLKALLGGEAEEERVRKDLNDQTLVPAETRTCYVFPGQELLFSWRESSSAGGVSRSGSASDVREKDWTGEDVRKQWSVKREKVGREGWSGDEERFWEGIEALWEGREE